MGFEWMMKYTSMAPRLIPFRTTDTALAQVLPCQVLLHRDPKRLLLGRGRVFQAVCGGADAGFVAAQEIDRP
jgi:hypothetical protein